MGKKRSINTTKLEIIKIALKMFLEKGYTNTSAKAICNKLGISTGNLTFHFHSKEHLLAVLVSLLCDFQWINIKRAIKSNKSAIMAFCLEFTSIAAICELDSLERDFYISSYTHPITLDIIRKNDTMKAKLVFNDYCSSWNDINFIEAETLVSGIEYATIKTTLNSAPLDIRISGALRAIMMIYNVPEDIYKNIINEILAMDYESYAKNQLKDFKKYIDNIDETMIEHIFIN